MAILESPLQNYVFRHSRLLFLIRVIRVFNIILCYYSIDAIKPVSSSKEDFDCLATHPLQSWAWGEFRKKWAKSGRFGIFESQKWSVPFSFFSPTSLIFL